MRCRTREIGIRMALGAKPRKVLRMVLRQGLTLTAIGLGIGSLIALVVGRFAASVLYGTSGADPLTFTLSQLFFSWQRRSPSWFQLSRAHVQPTTALRYEIV